MSFSSFALSHPFCCCYCLFLGDFAFVEEGHRHYFLKDEGGLVSDEAIVSGGFTSRMSNALLPRDLTEQRPIASMFVPLPAKESPFVPTPAASEKSQSPTQMISSSARLTDGTPLQLTEKQDMAALEPTRAVPPRPLLPSSSTCSLLQSESAIAAGRLEVPERDSPTTAPEIRKEIESKPEELQPCGEKRERAAVLCSF